MGLMDILNGMQNGPRGQSQPAPAGGSHGMSPIVTALLGLLAYKAIKSGGLGNMLGGNQPSVQNPNRDTGAANSGGLGGLLGGLFGGQSAGAPSGGMGGLLGGLLGGGAAGSVLSSGLGNLLKDFQSTGNGQVAQSWIGTGRNEEISPEALEKAIGNDTLSKLMAQSGLSRTELLEGLREHLPNLVDKLTPEGRLPTEQEAARL
jgi:uncharacterized protein YidB (DUF937 family)